MLAPTHARDCRSLNWNTTRKEVIQEYDRLLEEIEQFRKDFASATDELLRTIYSMYPQEQRILKD